VALTITVKMSYYSTENKQKLEQCFIHLLGELPEIQEVKDIETKKLVAENQPISSIRNFFFIIRERKILDTVRKCAFIDEINESVSFLLHKQALYVNKIAVITSDTSSPLGNVELIIKGGNPIEILNWIAPETSDGEELIRQKFRDYQKL